MKMKLIAVSAALALCSPLTWAASSSFQNSCRNIEMEVNDNGMHITAQCQAANGSYNLASYRLSGLVNDNGRIGINSGQSTSFHHSCRDIELNLNPGDVKLAAICRTASGNERKTFLEIFNVENRNGRLVFVRS